MRYLTIFLLLTVSTALATEVHFSRDENGNVVFSDKPSANSERFEVKEIPTMPALVVPAKETTDTKKPVETFEYTTLTLVSPTHEQSIPMGHAGNVQVTGVLSPGLRPSDTIFLLNRQQVLRKGRQTSFDLTNLSRGEHVLQLVVRDKDGKDLIASNPVTIYVQRASVLRRN